MSTTYKIGESSLNLSIISEIIESDKNIRLDQIAKKKINDF